jgi:hypothetical protein
MKKINKKILCFMFILLLMGVVFTSAKAIKKNDFDFEKTINLISFEQNFSKPVFETIGENLISVSVKEAEYTSTIQGRQMLPTYVKTFELPWGSQIVDIVFDYSKPQEILVSKQIQRAPVFKTVSNGHIIMDNSLNFITSDDLVYYPKEWYNIQKGVGLNKNGDHVLFLTFTVYPARYNSSENKIFFIDYVNFSVEYEITMESLFLIKSVYDLVIITPLIYEKNLIELVEHKNYYGVKTNLIFLEDIYESYTGTDHPEQIKYFIKNAVEEWGIKYVLLIGDIKKLPIRQTDAYPWDGYHGDGILTDLYYSDIYDENYSFASWDTNNNGTYGELNFKGRYSSFDSAIAVDKLDLYADVHIGRLACRNADEVDLLVNKIINYETKTYGEEWFKKIILAGGDTFSLLHGSPPFIYEGEITNQIIADEMPDFKHIKLWSSKNTLGTFTFNWAINRGTGFVEYAGHGFEHGWGTYKPNAFRKKMISFIDPMYFTPYLQFLRNKDKLPIIFFDACLTAKLDFNIGDIADYSNIVNFALKLTGIDYDISNYMPCFAWCFLIEEDGGGIGAVGATRPAYSFVDQKGVHAGAGYLDWMFFKSYSEGMHLGEMLTQAQLLYMTTNFKDYFTIQEYILLGDPSLMVGGYPPI